MPSPECEKLVGKMHKRKSEEPAELAESRVFVDDSGSYFTIPESVTCTPVDVDGIPGEWLIPNGASDHGVLYYLHGGGYVLGSIKSHRHLVAELAEAAGLRALMIDYRLAPEHPFPAAIDDAIVGFKWLLTQGYPANEVVISGDSAGGGLSLAALLTLRDTGAELPLSAMLLSPWTDLTNSVATRVTKREEDPSLTVSGSLAHASSYANGQNTSHPYMSPMRANLTGLPPMLVQVGTMEILLDDSLLLVEKAKADGVDIQLDVWEDMFHVWQYYVQKIPEAQEAIDELAAYARSILA